MHGFDCSPGCFGWITVGQSGFSLIGFNCLVTCLRPVVSILCIYFPLLDHKEDLVLVWPAQVLNLANGLSLARWIK